MAGKKKNEILYVMADTETSNIQLNNETNLETYAQYKRVIRQFI